MAVMRRDVKERRTEVSWTQAAAHGQEGGPVRWLVSERISPDQSRASWVTSWGAEWKNAWAASA